MFVRNGEVLGSVQVEPKAEPEPQKAPEPEPTPEPEQEPQDPPKTSDTKAEWVAYVVAATADTDEPVSEEDAEAMTKAELIELYGG